MHSIIGSIDDKKPCTKLNYEVDISQMRTMDHNGQLSAISANQAIFAIHFMSPARVLVKEEYLVYDFVAMISTIGGTMGLFIGFSFNGLTSGTLSLMEHFQMRMSKTNKNKTHERRVQVEALAQSKPVTEADLTRLEIRIRSTLVKSMKREIISDLLKQKY